MPRITSLVPTARSATVAGRAVVVSPATIRDLAEIQLWLDGKVPDPLQEVWPSLFGSDSLSGEPRWALVRDALAKPDPLEWDSPEGDAMLWTVEGVAVTLWLACRSTPGMTPDLCARMAVESNASEIALVRRIFFGVDSSWELQRILLEGLSGPAQPPTMTWQEAIHRVSESMGWTYREVYGLTLAEFGNVMRGGKSPELPVSFASGPAWKTFRERVNGPKGVAPPIGGATSDPAAE
jgi:hypothetical protein